MEHWKGLGWWKVARVILISLFAAASLAGQSEGKFPPSPEIRPLPDFYVRVADTHTRVFIAKVHLEISHLILSDEDNVPALVGNYDFRVPLRSSKNETGGMTLPLERPLNEYLTEGGVMEGKGASYTRPDRIRHITCEVRPGSEGGRTGQIHFSIDTGDRVLEFTSTYEVVGELPSREVAGAGSAGKRPQRQRGQAMFLAGSRGALAKG